MPAMSGSQMFSSSQNETPVLLGNLYLLPLAPQPSVSTNVTLPLRIYLVWLFVSKLNLTSFTLHYVLDAHLYST